MTILYEGFRQVAGAKGWTLDPADPGVLDAMDPFNSVTLSGSEGDVRVRLERWAYGNQFTSFALIEPKLPVKVAMSSEGPLTKLGHLVGIHDVEVGEPEFDRRLRVVGDDPAVIKQLLTPKVRELLVRLDESTRSFDSRFHVAEGVISVLRIHLGPMSADDVLHDVPLITDLARALRESAAAMV
jgi:hypothetical protein